MSQPQTQLIFYILVLLISLSFIGYPAKANLYSEFNNKLDLVSNYAENTVKAETSSTLDKIYEDNGKLLQKYFEQKFQDGDRKNADKLEENTEIDKLMDVLSPYYKSLSGKMANLHEHLEPTTVQAEFVKKKSPSVLNNVNDKPNVMDDFKHSDGYKWISDYWKPLSERQIDLLLNFKSAIRHRRTRGATIGMIDPKTVMNTVPSLYPGIIAKGADLSGLNLDTNFGDKPPIIPSNDQIRDIQNILRQNVPRAISPAAAAAPPPPASPPAAAGVPPTPAATPPPTENISNGGGSNGADGDLNSVLEKVLDELEVIKSTKMGQCVPDGIPCELNGAWNSEIIGLRFDIKFPTNEVRDMVVGLKGREPLKRSAFMDPTWTCTGGAVKSLGGPFFITARQKTANTLATFAGLCKKCGSTDMIFGSWTFVYPAKDCQDVSLSIVNRRDVFRRDVLDEKIKNRKNMLKNGKKP